jgi:hypothetical protein
MEGHHWGGQGWNAAVEPQEEEEIFIILRNFIFYAAIPLLVSKQNFSSR